MKVSYDFEGAAVLVTGGSSGIGRATARALASAGARVCVAARDLERAERVARELGGHAFAVAMDVRDEASVVAGVGDAVARLGGLDVAVNDAGIGGDMATLEGTTQSVWDDVVATNARGVWLCMRHQAQAMLASGRGGAIVNASSVYGVAGRAAHHAYVASKHAVVGMTRSVALELAPRGVRVNALCAGLTRTESVAQVETAFPDVVRALVAEHPIGRMATVDEIAAATLWLCSSGASYVTGVPLAVDGGFLAA